MERITKSLESRHSDHLETESSESDVKMKISVGRDVGQGLGHSNKKVGIKVKDTSRQ
jgi:hypothetical protein